ncbi:hypothetical protein DL95DRAFT_457463 [Leptodontidium sp. 2 PMI_412]|nr:hypothetical protein DL95DRAFT_457463 [Leptodontidium sp. 2 PMI_412]
MIFAQDLKTHFRSYMTSSSPLLQALTTMSKSGNCTRLQLDLHTQALATWTRLSHFVTLPSDLLTLDRRGYRQILAVKHLVFASMSFLTGQKITLKNELETICFDITRVERWRIKNTSHLLGLIIPAAINVYPKTRRRCLDKWGMDSMDEMLGTKCTIVDYPEVPDGEPKRLRDWIWSGPFRKPLSPLRT